MISEPLDDFWEFSFAVAPATPVRCVSAAGGLVIAAGASLHMLRPGSQRLRSRALPPDFDVIAVAAEPWSPYRFAIASSTIVGIYTGHKPYEPIYGRRFVDPKLRATHLAWSRRDGQSILYFRQSDGKVPQLVPEDPEQDGVLNGPVVQAIASDGNGILSLAELVPTPPANTGDVWILPEGARAWSKRWVDYYTMSEDDPDTHTYLAVHGRAVALSGDDGFATVSWERGEDETETENSEERTFVMLPGVFMGPIAFQNDHVIFAAYNVEGQVRILRHARNGGITRIARFGVGDDWTTGVPATVTGLAWDEERRVLWAASPELGLIKLTEPAARDTKLPLN